MAEARAWQRMLSGRRLNLLDPSPLDVEIEDIALGLSRVARWNGQTIGAWSYTVAQHSLLVEQLVRHRKPSSSPQDCLAALLHDAPEYVIGDLITPFKAAVGLGYKELEHRLAAAIHLRFGLPAQLDEDLSKRIKRADRAAAALEAKQLAGFSSAEVRRYFGDPQGLPTIVIQADQPETARKAFLQRFEELVDTSRQ